MFLDKLLDYCVTKEGFSSVIHSSSEGNFLVSRFIISGLLVESASFSTFLL